MQLRSQVGVFALWQLLGAACRVEDLDEVGDGLGVDCFLELLNFGHVGENLGDRVALTDM